ncbi:MAG: hypothetical protein U1E52_08495 [Geminicoccaceae bacterium]
MAKEWFTPVKSLGSILPASIAATSFGPYGGFGMPVVTIEELPYR